MKRIFLIFTFLFAFVFSSLAANATDNRLHTITLEKNDTGYNIILGTDKVAKVTKKAIGENELVLELQNTTSSDTVNALYKGTNNIDGLIIENAASKLKIYVKAVNVRYSTVMIEALDGTTTIVGESVPVDKILWVVCVMALFSVIFKISKDIAEDDDKILIKKDIKDREIQMYRKYRSDVFDNRSIDARYSIRMNKMLKKIDRKIDERLTASIK
jgi:hypothetical protein